MLAWSKKCRVMRRYDQSAKVYDTQYREEQGAKIRTAMGYLTFKDDGVVLDVGCGTGLLFEHIAGKTKFVVGTDISRGILEEAKKKTKFYKNAALILADADNMPFRSQVFNMVLAITLLQNLPNPRATLNEIKEVSESNAIIVVTGLRKAFTEREFTEMLRQAKLKVVTLKLDEQMREYVSICTKAAVKSKFLPNININETSPKTERSEGKKHI